MFTSITKNLYFHFIVTYHFGPKHSLGWVPPLAPGNLHLLTKNHILLQKNPRLCKHLLWELLQQSPQTVWKNGGATGILIVPFIAKALKKAVLSWEQLGCCSWVLSLFWMLVLPRDSCSSLVSVSKRVPLALLIIGLGNQATELFFLPKIQLWFPAQTSCDFHGRQTQAWLHHIRGLWPFLSSLVLNLSFFLF